MEIDSYYNADSLRDHFKRQHRLSLNTARSARVEPRYYAPGDQAYWLAEAGKFRRAITMLPAFAHPVATLAYTYLTPTELRVLKSAAGLTSR